jgi:FixJ family two-component response regulator
MDEPFLPTVFIVDDDSAVRRSLARLLKSAGYRSEAFASADEFLECWSLRPLCGCVLLDLQMPGLDGLSLQQRIQGSPKEIPIIFITGHGDVPSSVSAMKTGAVDFLSKPLKEEELLRAVEEAIQRGERERAVRSEREELSRRYRTLTARERDVMALVVRGLLNKQVAAELGTSEKTVKIHRGRVMAKMQAASLADLVRAGEKIGVRGAAK